MIQEIESHRLRLEEIHTRHVDLFFKLHSDPRVDQFNTMGIPANPQETARILQPAIDNQSIEPRSKFCWAVFRKQDQAFIGEAGLSHSGPKYRRGEVHYLIMPAQWGQGYATEIVRALIKFGFDTLGLHRIEAGVATQNAASIKVLEKAGMTLEGKHRKILPIRGQWVDNYHYAILESDPRT